MLPVKPSPQKVTILSEKRAISQLVASVSSDRIARLARHADILSPDAPAFPFSFNAQPKA
jgi:hypothetical protein